MTLEQAIQHCKEVAIEYEAKGECYECGKEHRQLAEWLEDYKQLKEHTKTIDPSDDRFGEMLNSALRYALGRMSYIAQDTADYIRPLIPYLDNRTLFVMNRDIEEAVDMNCLGMKMDAEVWTALRADIVREMDKRKQNG